MRAISQVTYTADSGPILPELQWHERITLTGDGVTQALPPEAASKLATP